MNATKHCKFYIKNKDRYCHLELSSPLDDYCIVHNPNKINTKERIICPYNSSHSVNKKRYKRHLRVCSDAPIKNKELYSNDNNNIPIPTTNKEITILYRKESLLIINKPSGLLCTPGASLDRQDCVEYRIRKLLNNENYKEKLPGRLCVHRLDMDTSGVLILALNSTLYNILSLYFKDQRIKKQYEAIVHGIIEDNEGNITIGISNDISSSRVKRKYVSLDSKDSKYSHTYWKVIERYYSNDLRYIDINNNPIPCTRIQLYPSTGRTHQLRIHMSYINHPILGDDLYGIKDGSKRLLLHAKQITIPNPDKTINKDIIVTSNDKI